VIGQLPLAWPAPASHRFEHFDPTGNAQALALLRDLADADAGPGAALLLAGPAGVGKTHLLVAGASRARERGRRAAYLALSRWSDFDADALSALAGHDLLAIDEIDQVAGRRAAEVALFDLYNRCRDRGVTLLLAAREPPARLPLTLPDLASRLSAATLLPLQPLPEPERRRLLQARAQARGFELDEAVLDFLFRRYRRDLPALLALVERLDRESLARQRRVTLPLVRAVLDLPAPDPD
jgi:DnaA family protein